MNRKRLYTLGPPRPPDVPEPFPEPPSLWTMVKPHLGKFYHRFKTAILVASGILITLLALLFYDLAKPDPERLTRQDVKNEIDLALEEQPPDPSYASLAYEIIHPSVVFIQSQTGESSDTGEGALGSGVVIVDSGIILTCLHVVKDASAINVIFADGSVSEAEVIVRQPENDLAVLQARIIPDDLIPAT
ncbi:MAG: serine protease, partial [Spirochaetales bacterium]